MKQYTIRYTRRDNEALSEVLIDTLRRQGFFPYICKNISQPI